MAIRFHLDEHVDEAIAIELRKHGIDVTTTVDAGLRGADDIDHVEFALRERRVIHTRDRDFLRLARSGAEHAGVAYCRTGTRTIGNVIEALMLIHGCITEEEMQ